MFCWHTVKHCVELEQKLQVAQNGKPVSGTTYVLTVAEITSKDGHHVTVSTNGGLPMSGQTTDFRPSDESVGRHLLSAASGHTIAAAVPGRKLPVASGTDGTVSIGRDGEAGTRVQETY